jgi:hypothetical protein
MTIFSEKKCAERGAGASFYKDKGARQMGRRKSLQDDANLRYGTNMRRGIAGF